VPHPPHSNPLDAAQAARKRISADKHELRAIKLRREADAIEARVAAKKAKVS
jgi:hypothetical protein